MVFSRLLLGSGVMAPSAPSSPDQSRGEGAKQGSAATAGVVDELEEAEIQRKLVLRDAPVRAQPGAQQRPGPFHRVDVDLAEAVAILVARVLPMRVADRHVPQTVTCR